MSKSGISDNPEYLSGDQLAIQDQQPAGTGNPMMPGINQPPFNPNMGQQRSGMGQPNMGGFNQPGMGQPNMGGFNQPNIWN